MNPGLSFVADERYDPCRPHSKLGVPIAVLEEVFTIAVLDTTINHAPEVFDYQLQPDDVGHDLAHRHPYLLAGATCLAGDLFGEYRSVRPLQIGSRR